MFGLSAPRAPATPPIWREGRTALELAALVREPRFRRADPHAGGGRPVLLVPGFLAGDETLGVLAGWLRRSGFRTGGAGMRPQRGLLHRGARRRWRRAPRLCASARAARGDHRPEPRRHARALAGRPPPGPRLGRGGDWLAADSTRWRSTRSPASRCGSSAHSAALGAPGLFSRGCLEGECCAEFRASAERPFPAGIGLRVDLLPQRRHR